MHDDPEYARGILHNVYSMLPSCYDNSEYATDDAVTNQCRTSFFRWRPVHGPTRPTTR